MAKKDVEYILDDSFEIFEKVKNMSEEEMDRQIAILEAAVLENALPRIKIRYFETEQSEYLKQCQFFSVEERNWMAFTFYQGMYCFAITVRATGKKIWG